MSSGKVRPLASRYASISSVMATPVWEKSSNIAAVSLSSTTAPVEKLWAVVLSLALTTVRVLLLLLVLE